MSFQRLDESRRTSGSREDRRPHPYKKPDFRAAHTRRDSPAPPSRPSQHEAHAFKQALLSTDLEQIAKAVSSFAKQYGLRGQHLPEIVKAINCFPPSGASIPTISRTLLSSLRYIRQEEGTPPEVYPLLQAIAGLIDQQDKMFNTWLSSLSALRGIAPHPAVTALLSAVSQHTSHAQWDYKSVADMLTGLRAHGDNPEAQKIIAHMLAKVPNWARMPEGALLLIFKALSELSPSPQTAVCLHRLQAALVSPLCTELGQDTVGSIMSQLGKIPQKVEAHACMAALYDKHIKNHEDTISLEDLMMLLQGAASTCNPSDPLLCQILETLRGHVEHQRVNSEFIIKALHCVESLPRGYKRDDEELDRQGLSQLDRRILSWLETLTTCIEKSKTKLSAHASNRQNEKAFCANHLLQLLPLLFDDKTPSPLKEAAYTLLHTLFKTYDVNPKWLDDEWLSSMHSAGRIPDVILGVLGFSHHRDEVPRQFDLHGILASLAEPIYDRVIERFCQYGQEGSKCKVVCGCPNISKSPNKTTLYDVLKTCLSKANLEQHGIKVTWQRDNGAVFMEKIKP